MTNHSDSRAFTLIELLATVALIGIVAAVILVRVGAVHDEGGDRACLLQKANIELAVQRWWRVNGGSPQADLSDIYGDSNYFPSGALTCPVDGTAYTIDTTSGEVIGHNH